MDERTPVAEPATDGTVARPRHLRDRGPIRTDPPHRARREGRPRWWRWVAVAVPVVLLAGLFGTWAVATSGSDVGTNVELAGTDIGGMSADELAPVVARVAEDFAAAQVEIVTGERTYTTTAAEIGVAVDTEATTLAALATADDGFVLGRPFRWLGHLFSSRQAHVRFRVDAPTTEQKILELQGADRVEPVEPTVELVDGDFRVVPGQDGRGIDPDRLVEALGRAADSGADPLRVEVEPEAIPPSGSDEQAEAAAARADALLAEPVEIRTEAGNRTVEPEVLRSWATLVSTGTDVAVGLDPAAVAGNLRDLFAGIDGAPKPASFTLEGGNPVVVPDQPGRVCCGPTPEATILGALESGQRTVEMGLVEGRAAFGVAEAQQWGITQAVGGDNAWRNGAPTTGPAGFTTYHSCCEARVTNIHRMADMVRGAVIPPGGTWSINDHVGQRTAAKGFVPAGAIRNGEHVDEIGGGVSQFATTTFNAAYFAGLDIVTYQAHSEYFSRYPIGREATMGYPAPDLRIRNNTPYGVMIWTSYTNTSLTVTMYSTPYATAEQTGKSESMNGNCRVVTTTRTRTFPDGRQENDTFRATYRPGEGQFC
ncbi:MAG: VanW family protein [Acidimicrobiia bacterium]